MIRCTLCRFKHQRSPRVAACSRAFATRDRRQAQSTGWGMPAGSCILAWIIVGLEKRLCISENAQKMMHEQLGRCLVGFQRQFREHLCILTMLRYMAPPT